jgi:hypothetical protein
VTIDKAEGFELDTKTPGKPGVLSFSRATS